MVSPFTAYLAEHFSELRSLAADVGRRRAKLQLATRFWSLSRDEKERLASLSEDVGSHDILSEALDDIDALQGADEAQISEYVDEGSVAGIIVRTDYSDDAAWSNFMETLSQAEKDFALPPVEGDQPMEGANADELDDHESGSDSDEEMSSPSQPPEKPSSSDSYGSLFAVLCPPASSPLRPRLVGASNLAILRLVNDVDVIRAPRPPAGTRNTTLASSENRLTNLHGFVEAYTEPLIWVYDSRSNTDGAARAVSRCSDGNGNATGDSWRARVSFLPELQINLIGGAMKIDFGGLDRWSHDERQRNLTEVDAPIL